MFEHVVLFQDVQSLFMYVGLNVFFYSSLGLYSTLKEFYPHSQTYHKRTPLGPSVAVRLRVVSACERLNNRKHLGG